MPNVIVPQPVSSYVLGDTWPPQFSYLVGGVATDPATLTVRVESPGAASDVDLAYGVAPTLVRLSAGVYVVSVPMAAVGKWKVRALATLVTAAGTTTRYTEWCAHCVASTLANPN